MTGWRELTFPGDTRKGLVLVIDDERANVLTDPLRWRILNTLGEGKSVAEISSMLGVTDSRVLRHLERLAGQMSYIFTKLVVTRGLGAASRR